MDSRLPAAGPIINTCNLGQEHRSDSFRYCIANTESLSFEEEKEEEEEGLGEGEEVKPRQHFQIPSLEDKMPFTQMLKSVESPSPFLPSFIQPQSFQVLLRLQRQIQRAWDQSHTHYSYLPPETTSPIKHGVVEPESCLTHDILDESETNNPHPSVSQEQPSFPTAAVQSSLDAVSGPLVKNVTDKEKRKRRATMTTTRQAKGKEEVESQRMIHIAVERNRRRQMNDRLNSLRSLMPPSYAQRVLSVTNPVSMK